MGLTTYLALALSATVLADGFVIFPPGTLGNTSTVNLTQSCINALQATVSCDQYFHDSVGSDTFGYIDPTYLDGTLCTSDCSKSLSSYHTGVVSACSSQPNPWDGIPAQLYGDKIWAKYNTTCLKSGGTYCQNYIANLTMPTTDSKLSSLPQAQLCSACVLAFAVLSQSTPYSNYGGNMAQDWANIQKTCGVTHPTAIPAAVGNYSNNPQYAPSGYPTPACISGRSYSVQSGDNCGAIADKEGVPSGTLILYNNQLLPDCSNLYVGQSLCVPESCTLHKVQSGDTCFGIANSTGITTTQLSAWNPYIDSNCGNLIAGNSVCVSQPGQVWNGTAIAGATATQTAVYATSTVAPPGPTAHGTTTHCGKYYQVHSGDDCHLIALNQTITVELFEQINPDVNSQCTNLVEGLCYCVFPTADWNSTSSGGGTTTACSASAAAPTASGTISQCCQYYTVQSGDYCAKIESSFGITMAQLQAWNPSINNDCGNLQLGVAYCVAGPAASSTPAQAARAVKRTAEPRALLQPSGRLANAWFAEADKLARMEL